MLGEKTRGTSWRVLIAVVFYGLVWAGTSPDPFRQLLGVTSGANCRFPLKAPRFQKPTRNCSFSRLVAICFPTSEDDVNNA